jgi:ribose transport system substrate-binding protein
MTKTAAAQQNSNSLATFGGKSMNFLKLSLAVLSVAVAIGLSACGGGDIGTKTKTLKIAVIPKGTSSPYWNIVHAGAVKAQQELQSTQPIEILYRGSVKESESAQAIAVVEDMINQQVDAIVLAPNDAGALARIVDRATAKKIPVIIIDSAVNTDTYKSYVATDNKKGGAMGGEELAKRLGNKGKVIMLRYQAGSASTNEREEGALTALKAHPEIQLADTNKYGGDTDDACQKNAENLLAGYKNADGTLSIDGIFCPNLTTTFGMLKALQTTKSIGKVKFIGFDSSEALVKAMKEGQMDALVVQDPINMGYLGVKTAVDVINGKKVDRLVDTGVHLVTKENMDTPASKEILDPPASKYLK